MVIVSAVVAGVRMSRARLAALHPRGQRCRDSNEASSRSWTPRTSTSYLKSLAREKPPQRRHGAAAATELGLVYESWQKIGNNGREGPGREGTGTAAFSSGARQSSLTSRVASRAMSWEQ